MQRVFAVLLCHRGQVGKWHCSGLDGAGKSGTAQTLAHLSLHPVPWLFPRHSLTPTHCTESLSARSCETLICLYTLRRSYSVLPFGATRLLVSAFRSPSGSAAQQPSALPCVPEAALTHLTPRYLCLLL